MKRAALIAVAILVGAPAVTAILVTGGGNSPGNVLWHRNGAAWTSVASPVDANIDSLTTAGAIASDGHGGIWAMGVGVSDRLYKTWDYRSGSWSGPSLITSAPNVTLWGLASVPHSAALWAYGMSTVTFSIDDGAIAGYQP